MKTTYLTLTIGPVVETLLTARRTREMWAASYLFSYIIRETISTACDANVELDGTAPILLGNVLLPVLQTDATNEYTYGAGLYPDRIFLKATDPANDAKRLNAAVDKVLETIGEKAKRTYSFKYKQGVAEKTGSQSVSEAEFKKYLHDYLRINILQNELEDGENIVAAITPYLDASEQYARLLPSEKPDSRNPLMLFFDNANASFLKADGFKENKNRGFESLMEIATKGLERLDAERYKAVVGLEDDEEQFIAQAKSEFSAEFRAYHKYVAIVHADGDNVGKVVAKVAKDPTQLKEFSQRLRDFALEATRKVHEYGGSPVYAGGDDMLFIAPVACGGQTIFSLLKEIDESFMEILVEFAKEVKAHEELDDSGNQVPNETLLPSLSHGVSISFYKYPLFEARNASFGQMEAIKHDGEKNGIGVKFLKHSGHAINFVLHKHRKDTYLAFLKLLEAHQPDDSDFLNSFTYKLENQRVLLSAAASNKGMLSDFFQNNFNEVWDQYKPFFQGLIPFIEALYKDSTAVEKEFRDNDPKHQNWTQLLYATLRFIHFLKSKDNDDDQ
ncbi:MAG: type III-B CRISPR-associated protein Cas10/Cmr2 [Saprospiraceae bacterium]|nr:type III-B CRISPR-associated protein Cas10/Cmr2 [Saprospiraceae bacterium]MCF8250960.1 type III-B CRISPR-associated protein Cas10/Cmr2 [Saprospiraceae bacterium]MCF8281937.1 type III-B CRISPR-associated protein Cas10/Cmr2 [Bacteroidales bacterium]MCF8311924.1 type III-B CRISPR-associated protein Cas10/Cmr2 [Saprospiraceae bacterium]MCF8441932.1 type III-B CRISPR-associated protein Cas10/Cmr2 [Saprospiraceae bacterium]